MKARDRAVIRSRTSGRFCILASMMGRFDFLYAATLISWSFFLVIFLSVNFVLSLFIWRSSRSFKVSFFVNRSAFANLQLITPVRVYRLLLKIYRDETERQIQKKKRHSNAHTKNNHAYRAKKFVRRAGCPFDVIRSAGVRRRSSPRGSHTPRIIYHLERNYSNRMEMEKI